MKLTRLLFSCAILLFSSHLSADEAIKKTIAIQYDQGKSPDDLLENAYNHFKDEIKNKKLLSVGYRDAMVFGKVIDIQVSSDNAVASSRECSVVAQDLQESMFVSNLPYSGRFTILKTNILFGDRSLAYALNPYKGCYNEDILLHTLKNSGYKIVALNENPDITMTIGIDACLTENEYKRFIQKNSSLQIAKDDNITKKSSNLIGNDLIQAGSNVQLSSHANSSTGVAVAGIGVALNIIDWLANKTPKERDLIRYHLKFEAKDKKTLDFYPMILTKDDHANDKPINLRAYSEIEKLLFSSFTAWNNNIDIQDSIPKAMFEKDIVKATQMMVSPSTLTFSSNNQNIK